MPRKKYISTGANPYSIDLMDNGVLRTFDFRGGVNHPVFIPPSYSTKDAHEQELLENYPMFNVTFKIGRVDEEEEVGSRKSEVGNEENVTNTVPVVMEIADSKEAAWEIINETKSEETEEATEDTATGEVAEDTTTNAGADDKVKVFKNAQDAKTWMIKEKKVSANAVRNKELLMAKAKEMGIDLILESDINN